MALHDRNIKDHFSEEVIFVASMFFRLSHHSNQFKTKAALISGMHQLIDFKVI